MENQTILSIDRELGVWIWNVSSYVPEPNGMLKFCKENGVTEIYYSVNRDVTDQSYVDLIKKTASYGITSCALTGDPAWILPDRQKAYRDYLERVKNINRLCLDGPKFESIHLDVEPHVLEEVRRDGMENYIKEITDLLKDARSQADRMGLSLGWDIPSWMGKFQDEIHGCSLDETFFLYCDTVGVMAYGDSPSVQTSKSLPNLFHAKKHGRKMMVGCETMDLDEARRANGNCAISYFEEGKGYMYKSIEKIRDNLAPVYDNFGFAIHHINSWINLQDHVLPQYIDDIEEI